MGGEPTVKEDLKNIILTVKKSRNKAAIITNGLKLSEISYLKELKHYGLELAVITFDGFNLKASQIIRGDKYNIDKVVKAIENAASLKLETWLQPLILKGVNEGGIKKIFEYMFNKKNITRIFFNSLYLSDGLRKKGFSEANLLSKEEFQKLICSSLDIEEKYFKLYYNLKIALLKLSLKFHPFTKIRFPVPFQLYLLREQGRFIPFLKINELEEIISIIERKCFYKFLGYKYIKLLFSFLMNGFLSLNIEKSFSRKGVLTVVIGTPRPSEALSLGYMSDDIIYDYKGIAAVRRSLDT
jgi:uncharacterized radical SAM superfamily Fe-S cluster-containing enzyme